MQQVLVITGLTASGKSKMGIDLAHHFNGEIISADSVAVYKDLDIGSAKLPLAERDGITHHLMDVYEYTDSFNVVEFQKEARRLIDDITSRGKLPIVVGGTGLYVNALLNDYRFEEELDRIQIEDNRDNETIYNELLDLDPKAAKQIHMNNRQRVLRALDRVKYHDKTSEEITSYNKDKRLYDATVFFLQGDRSKMYERINQRVEVMFEEGLVEEVTLLLKKTPHLFDLQSVQSIGYREFKSFFDGVMSLEEVKHLIQRNTRRFAKRQITWFKHQTPNITIDIFEPGFYGDVVKVVTEWIK